MRPGERDNTSPVRLAASAFLLVLLTACGQGDSEPVPASAGGEAQALEDAAAMLEEQRHPTEASAASAEQTPAGSGQGE